MYLCKRKSQPDLVCVINCCWNFPWGLLLSFGLFTQFELMPGVMATGSLACAHKWANPKDNAVRNTWRQQWRHGNISYYNLNLLHQKTQSQALGLRGFLVLWCFIFLQHHMGFQKCKFALHSFDFIFRHCRVFKVKSSIISAQAVCCSVRRVEVDQL